MLHVGLAGGREVPLGSLVVGTEAVYCDLSADWPVVDRALPDARLVEAMEGFGVLRAAALAGVPAVEVRAISNAIGEEDRARWDLAAGLAALERAMPALVAAVTARGS